MSHFSCAIHVEGLVLGLEMKSLFAFVEFSRMQDAEEAVRDFRDTENKSDTSDPFRFVKVQMSKRTSTTEG